MAWLLADGSDRGHRIVRRSLAALIGLRLITRDLQALADQPDAQFSPPALLSWMSGPPSAAVLIGLQVVGFVLAGLAATGVGSTVRAGLRPAAVRLARLTATGSLAGAWLALLTVSAIATSGGKILHNDVLLLLVALPFALVPENRRRLAADGLAPVGARRNVGWPRQLALAVIALAYAMAGVAKLVHTGPSWVFSENMRYVMYWSAQTPHPAWPALTELLARHSGLAQLTAGAILAIELAFPVILVARRARPWFALGAVGLHVGTWLTLGLDYWGWALTVVIVLIDWERVADRVADGRAAPARCSAVATSG